VAVKQRKVDAWFYRCAALVTLDDVATSLWNLQVSLSLSKEIRPLAKHAVSMVHNPNCCLRLVNLPGRPENRFFCASVPSTNVQVAAATSFQLINARHCFAWSRADYPTGKSLSILELSARLAYPQQATTSIRVGCRLWQTLIFSGLAAQSRSLSSPIFSVRHLRYEALSSLQLLLSVAVAARCAVLSHVVSATRQAPPWFYPRRSCLHPLRAPQ